MHDKDPIVELLKAALPTDIVGQCQAQLDWLATGNYEALLASSDASTIFNDLGVHVAKDGPLDAEEWLGSLARRLDNALAEPSKPELSLKYFCIGYGALLAFTQANVTGPPLTIPHGGSLILIDRDRSSSWHADLLTSLARDGVAPYSLAPHVDLLCVATAILSNDVLLRTIMPARWIRMRAAFMHQRVLTELSPSLENTIFDDLKNLTRDLSPNVLQISDDIRINLMLEEAVMQLHYGHDQKARECLAEATKSRRFVHVLTGHLGKRTKYQHRDISQLVVLAKSAEVQDIDRGVQPSALAQSRETQVQPKDLDLNDDTLLERIEFTRQDEHKLADGQEMIPESLRKLDPSEQPLLDPLDSTILLLYASSITNTSPDHGLTREELLPYAVRVLLGGSSNWQVYTQALLVRSRIEGFNSRTAERGLLQLQALVDQMIIETSKSQSTGDERASNSVSTFLPALRSEENAAVTERLQYVFQLAAPLRWELEAELASRWVQLGGLRTALDIYERLQLWAEAALCLAATEEEDKARKLIKSQLFLPGPEGGQADGAPREPPPADAPRLYCILGDLDHKIEWYETAWSVSKLRYARAQRSIGRMCFAQHDYSRAVDAYTKSLSINSLNKSSWFALGCALLELKRYSKAVEAFSRSVQLDDTDAESWSNLGAALLKIDTSTTETQQSNAPALDDEEQDELPVIDSSASYRQKNLRNALKAFKQASAIKHESYRIWHNIMVTAASVTPPEYTSVLNAQRRIVQLRGQQEGESCFDVEIIERLVDHVIRSETHYDPSKPGLARMTVKFVEEAMVPLISSSPRLWHLLSKLSLWRGRPGSALEAEEKAWRAATAIPGWDLDNETAWDAVVEATIRLCDAYESLGPQAKTEGLGGGSGKVVASDWMYKARSAIRGISAKGKDSWEDTSRWDRLQEAQRNLKA